MTEPIRPAEVLAPWLRHRSTACARNNHADPCTCGLDAALDALLARLDAAEAAAVPDGWKVVRVDGIPYLTPDRIRPLTEGEEL